MHIDFTLQMYDKTLDISANCKQNIGDALREALRHPLYFAYNLDYPDYYFSLMQCRMVSAYMTFEEEEIRNGDKLIWERL